MAEIVLMKTADAYRGELSCLRILTPHTERRIDSSGTPDISEIYVGEEMVGHLRWWYGSGGKGGDAAAEFHPTEGVQVVWICRDAYFDLFEVARAFLRKKASFSELRAAVLLALPEPI